jgi:virginiamycin B lyase
VAGLVPKLDPALAGVAARVPRSKSVSVRRCATSLAITFLLLAGCGGAATSTPGSPVVSPSALTGAETVTVAPGPLPSVASLDAALKITDDSQPDWVLVSDGVAWVATTGGIRRYSAGGRILGTTAVGGPVCLAMDAGFDAVWVGVCGPSAAVVRLDAATGEVIARISIDGGLQSEGSLGAGEGAVWGITANPARLVRIDPATNTVSEAFTLEVGAAGVRADEGGVWVTLADNGRVLHIDPASGEVVKTIEVGSAPRFLAIGEGGVWVMNNGDGSVSRIDPETDKVVATIGVDDGPINGGDIAAGGGSVWARVSSSVVSQIDPKDNTITARYGSGSGSGSVGADDAAVWISAHDVSTI